MNMIFFANKRSSNSNTQKEIELPIEFKASRITWVLCAICMVLGIAGVVGGLVFKNGFYFVALLGLFFIILSLGYLKFCAKTKIYIDSNFIKYTGMNRTVQMPLQQTAVKQINGFFVLSYNETEIALSPIYKNYSTLTSFLEKLEKQNYIRSI